MSGLDCYEYITLPLSIASSVLLIFSEVLGMQSEKTNKCTSLIQVICACSLWMYLKVKKVCCCQRPPPPKDDDDVQATVSRHVSVKFPTWRGRKASQASSTQPLAPPSIQPAVTYSTLGEDLSTVLNQHLGGDSVVLVISRPPSQAGHRDQ